MNKKNYDFYKNKKKKILLFLKNLTTKKIKVKFILFIQESLYLLRLKIFFSVLLKRKNIFNPKIFKNPIFLYDLRCSSLTFDFADYLFLTNLWLKKFGYENCDCIIFGGFENLALMKFRSYDLAINKNELWERVDNVIKPLAENANFINSIKLISDVNSLRNTLKESFLVFPPHYTNLESQNIYLEGVPQNRLEILTNNKKNLTHLVKFLEPDLNDIKHVKKKLKITEADKIVTFTVRDYQFEEVRNTNYYYLRNLSKFFASKGYRFIVLPDHKNQSPNINMFITNILKDGNHYGSFRDLKKLYGRGFKWHKQPFLDTDMHIIFGPEDDISNLTSYKRIKEIMKYDNL